MENPKPGDVPSLKRGDVVLSCGLYWSVFAVSNGVAWLTCGEPWLWLRVEVAHRCARAPGRACATAPWEIN